MKRYILLPLVVSIVAIAFEGKVATEFEGIAEKPAFTESIGHAAPSAFRRVQQLQRQRSKLESRIQQIDAAVQEQNNIFLGSYQDAATHRAAYLQMQDLLKQRSDLEEKILDIRVELNQLQKAPIRPRRPAPPVPLIK